MNTYQLKEETRIDQGKDDRHRLESKKPEMVYSLLLIMKLGECFYDFYFYHSVHCESISKNSNKMTLYSTLLFPVSRSTCFGHIPCPSSGAQLTVLTASGVDKQCVSSHRRLTGNNKVLYSVILLEFFEIVFMI
jgi:hypothetical protein